MKIRKLIAAVAVTLTLTATAARTPNAEADRWADSVYNTLTERQRVAQLIFPTFDPAGGEATRASIKRLVDMGVGGLLFSGGTFEQYASMISYAQSQAKVPLLITYDGEWGLNMRIKDAVRFPKNMALGAIADYRLLYDYGAEMARQCKLLGVTVNFAPDADVNSNPKNPVIGQRSFGEDPTRVAKAATAYALGLEDNGVQAVAKHFPGHGDTDVDSHKALPTVNHTIEQLNATDLVPFKDFISSGCSGIMVGHISVPSLDASGKPASQSKAICTKLLRDDLGYEGLLYTDALAMKGANAENGNNALASLMAGADVLLNPTQPVKALDAIMQAIADGKVSKAEIEQHCKRILRTKYLFEAGGKPQGTAAEICRKVNSPEAEALIQRLADASITVVRNGGQLLPLTPAKINNAAVVNLGAKAANDFTATCRIYTAVKAYSAGNEGLTSVTVSKANENDLVIAAVYDDKESTRQSFARLVAESTKPVIAVFFITPYRAAKFSPAVGKADVVVMGYEDIAPERTAAAQALFGGIAVSGRLPVDAPGLGQLGQGIDLPKIALGVSSPVAEGMASWLADSLTMTVRQALNNGAFPGCQLLVARNGNIVYDRCFGRLSNDRQSAEVNPETAYDLASVSKATGTLAGIMKAYDMGLFKLDDKLGKHVPYIQDPAKKNLTLRKLLYHETGMPAAMNMYRLLIDTASYTGKLVTPRADAEHTIKLERRAYAHKNARLRKDITSTDKSAKFPVEAAKGIFTGKATYDTIMNRIYNNVQLKNPSYRYSCLNFCMLMDVEQRLTGKEHDKFVVEEVFAPLGAYRTNYRGAKTLGADNIAATENDNFLRRQTLKGYVHDELAAFSGGVQGNAGLFGNAHDLAKYCQMLLNGGTYAGQRILKESTVKLFTTDKSPNSRRGLGFDKPDPSDTKKSPTCEEAGIEVYGHTGFTGTCFWVDPSKNLIFIFLCNRVNPSRDNAAWTRSGIRPRLFSLILRACEQ